MDRDKVLQFKEAVKWSFIAHFIFFVIVLAVILFENIYLKICLSFIGLIYTIYYLLLKKYDEKDLFINSLILFFTVIHIGVLWGYFTDVVTAMLIGIIVSIQDVISFTKFGKWTLNAKAMSNPKLLAKLILYSKSVKDGHLIPTKGMGDFLFYSLWVSKIYYHELNIQYLLMAFVAVLIGTSIDYIIISKMYLNENYKGFPATIITFVCLLPIFIMYILKLP